MATRITAQDFVKQVGELQQRLQTESDRIAELPPQEQIVETQSETLRAEGATLTDLQQKVQMAVLGQPGFTIVGLSNDQAIEIQEKLAESASIIEGLENDGALAFELAEVSQLTQSLLSNPNPTQAASLLNRVHQASTSHGRLNTGANDAVKTLESALKAMTQPVQNGNRQAPRQNGAPAAPRHTQPPRNTTPQPPAPPSYNQNGALEQERQLKDAQDQDYQASLFKDQFKELQKKLTTDPIKDFEMVLAHYKAVHGYVINVPVFRSTNAGLSFFGMQTQLEAMLDKYINDQAAKEAPAPAPQVQAQPQGQNGPLNVLKATLEAFTKAANIELASINKLKSAYEALNANDKERLFNAVNDIKKAKNEALLGAAFKKLNPHQWPGSSADKLKAVEKLLGGSSSSAQPAAPAIPPAPKKADGMRNRFNEVKNMRPIPVSQPSHNSSSSLSSLGLSADEYAFINGDTGAGQIARQGNAVSAHPNVATMLRLQHTLQSITPELSEYQLGRIVTDLYNMVSEGKKSIFQMSGADLRHIGDRPFFHLYFIHKNEAPEILKDDMEYGGKAFAGAIPGTTHLERARCMSRAIVELALENIEDAINFENGELLVRSLDILEEIELNEKDRAEGHKNFAHQLFGAFYHAHVAARNGNGSLIDPSDSRFQGDFGRHAFRGNYVGVDPAIKLQVIAQVRNALKEVWKL
jgi:hypothetical protein